VRLFFYGTLMDADLAEFVLGRRLPPRVLRPALLCGWRRVAARAVAYPVLLRCRGSNVPGCILDRVSPAERRRLTAYEGTGYVLRRGLARRDGRPVGVQFFAPRAAILPAGAAALVARPLAPSRKKGSNAGPRPALSNIFINSPNFCARAPDDFLKQSISAVAQPAAHRRDRNRT
jgi:hypothetical protein